MYIEQEEAIYSSTNYTFCSMILVLIEYVIDFYMSSQIPAFKFWKLAKKSFQWLIYSFTLRYNVILSKASLNEKKELEKKERKF